MLSKTVTRTSTTLLLDLRDPSKNGAWDFFDRCYRPIVVNFARQCGLQEADAEDIAQDTMSEFLRAYVAGKYQRSLGTRLRDWLKGIAANRIREHFRCKSRDQSRRAVIGRGQTDVLLKMPEQGRSDAWEHQWRKHILSLCLRAVQLEFDPKTFRAFEQYAIQQQEPNDVASDLGITRNAVYIAKCRVLDRMQSLYRGLDDPDEQ